MTIDEAFQLVNNVDIPEGLKRKFGPGYSLILVNRTGDIVRIERFKQPPSEAQQLATLNLEPECIAICGRPWMYETPDALHARIAKSMWLFDQMIQKPQSQ